MAATLPQIGQIIFGTAYVLTVTQWHKIVRPLFHLSTLHKYFWHFDHCNINHNL